MKMNKKKLAVLSLVLCVAAVVSMSSLAWFSAEDSVTNTLNFVNDFAMDVYETKEDGTKVGVGGDTVGLVFDNLVPNQKIHKDPTVLNKSATEPQWVRMTVKVSKGQDWINFLGVDASLEVIFRGYTDALWEHPEDTKLDDEGNLVRTFYLREKLAPGATITLFNEVYIHSAMTTADAAKLTGTTITIQAKAIQSSQVDADSCRAAFAIVEGK